MISNTNMQTRLLLYKTPYYLLKILSEYVMFYIDLFASLEIQRILNYRGIFRNYLGRKN